MKTIALSFRIERLNKNMQSKDDTKIENILGIEFIESTDKNI